MLYAIDVIVIDRYNAAGFMSFDINFKMIFHFSLVSCAQR